MDSPSNDHNVYILGAGFSRDRGYPLMSDFLEKMRDAIPWLESENRQAEADSIKEVLQFRLEAASAAYWTPLDLENIEELFSLASTKLNPDFEKHIKRSIVSTIDYLNSINTEETISFRCIGNDNVSWAIHQYKWINVDENSDTKEDDDNGFFEAKMYTYYIAALLGMFDENIDLETISKKNTFITFNYDTLIEESLESIGLPYQYGFTPTESIKIDASSKAKFTEGVNILKLHGSVNWFANDQNEITVFGTGDHQLHLNDGLTPVLIPPTWKKVFNNSINGVWDSAIESLKTATRIIIIGFSMPPTDLHFKFLLAAGLQKNISLRNILFFDPAAEEIQGRASKILRSSYIGSDVKSRIQFISKNLRSFCKSSSHLDQINRPLRKIAFY